MPQSLSTVYVHLVFSTKDRQPWLRDITLRTNLHEFLGGTSRTLECAPELIGGVEDHVHVLARLGRTITQADYVKEMKRVSSIWITQESASCKDFSWQSGYGIFSVSAINLDEIRKYIATQEEHHQRFSFQDEFRTILQRFEIEYDERYVWD